MAIKPMLFNTKMVRAILSGQKTCTRRVVKPQPGDQIDADWECGRKSNGELVVLTPPCRPGDILYVRETWSKLKYPDGLDRYVYKASDEYPFGEDGYIVKFRWKPSIHMPKEAARIFLRVTDVRVERLHHSFFEPICPILAIQAEGIDIGDTCRQCIENYREPCCIDTVDKDGSNLYGGECGMLDENRGEFSDLWDSTIKPADLDRYGWAANPWVWVIEFERISKEAALGGPNNG